MRKLIAGIFLTIYCLALLRPVLPMIEYAANKEFIATVLCLNKDKPELKCDGKCILAQKLARAQGQSLPEFPINAQEVENNLSLHLSPYVSGVLELDLHAWKFEECFGMLPQNHPTPPSPPPWNS